MDAKTRSQLKELRDTLRDLRSAINANDWVYADVCMGDIEGIGAQLREMIDERNKS